MVEGRLGAIRASRSRIALMRSVVSDVAQLGAGGADGRGERRETKPAEALRPAVGARAAFYDDRLELMDGADLIEMERAGRRCGVCRSGRGWRRFEVVRPPGREPVVLCGSCRARFGDDPPVGRKPVPEPGPMPPLSCRRGRKLRRARSSRVGIACERHCARCPARSRLRWSREPQA